MTFTDALQPFGPALTFSPRLCPIPGGTNSTISPSDPLSGADPDGWTAQAIESIREASGLIRTEQETCRKRLKAKGFLEEKYQGLPRKLYVRVNKEALHQAWQRHRELARPHAENPPYGQEEDEEAPAPGDSDPVLSPLAVSAPTKEDPGCPAF
ncbi:MAG: hypothetical protein IT210_11930 [Armatimonadetes bacterium]|nr:hypothetical protein [Armatimonadota bacterium]